MSMFQAKQHLLQPGLSTGTGVANQVGQSATQLGQVRRLMGAATTFILHCT